MHGTARTAITAAAATLLAVSPVFATAAHADHTTVAHWTLDSEPTMVDSEGGHDGVASRVKLVKGHNGNAYSFDGKRSVAYASDSEDLNPDDDAVRISLWIKTKYRPAKPDWDLFKKGYAGKSDLMKIEYQPDGRVSLGFEGSEGKKNLYGGPRLNDNRWHEVAAEKTDDEIRLMIDGKTVASKRIRIGSINNDYNVIIGAYRERANAGQFHGLIDDVRVEIGD